MDRNSVKTNILETIGNTPIVRLNHVTQGLQPTFWAKLEYFNPGGSVKDRIGGALIEDFEKRGLLKPGGTIVEGTSGNTGVGLAIAAAIKGYKCIFVLPDKMSEEKIRTLRAFGARVVVTPTAVEPEDPRSYYQVSRRLAQETPNAVYINQYDNLANREAHFQATGPEILKQMPEVDAFVAGMGTGGTLCGTGRYLKEHKASCQVIGVDPIGSIVYETFKTGKATHPAQGYKLEGIGEDFIPQNYDFSVIDDIVQVGDKESFLMTRELLTKEGIYCGVSAGAAVVAATKWAREQQAQGKDLRGKNVLIILPDSGNRYLSKVFNDDWMREAGFIEPKALGTVGDLLNARAIKHDKIVTARPLDKISTVIDLMRGKDISQVPVVDERGFIKGLATEGAILRALASGHTSVKDTIELLIDPSVEFVTPTDRLEKVTQIVSNGRVALVHSAESSSAGDDLLAILTKIDLLTYLGSQNG